MRRLAAVLAFCGVVGGAGLAQEMKDPADLEILKGRAPAATPSAALTCRVRLVRTAVAPARITAAGFGAVTVGEWTAWKPVKELVGKEDRITAAFEGCKEVECEFQIVLNGKPLKTLSERGGEPYCTIFLPRDLLDKGVDPGSAQFLERCVTLTERTRIEHARLAEYFRGKGRVPARYDFESFVHGLGLGWYLEVGNTGEERTRGRFHGSVEANRNILQALRLVGYNCFLWEKNLQRAEKAGMREQFSNRLTFHHYSPPWRDSPCPFGPKVEENRQTVVKEHAALAEKYREIKSLWLVWGDEVGVAAKNDHITACGACAGAYREYLKGLGAQPALFGKRGWDEVAPFGGEPATPEEAAAFYHTFRFWTYATARAYEPATQALKAAGMNVYPLMGSVPARNGHSLDFFEFYDATPSTTIAWETTNRDPRVWQRDAYMADITRTISRKNGQPVLVYVKPHRGATAQRLLGIAARGVTAFDWYDDETGRRGFSGQDERIDRNLRTQGDAARLLGFAEEVLYDARRVPDRSEVALLNPRTAFIGVTSRPDFQDAIWVWTALRHDGVAVDVIDERLVEAGDLEGRKALYLVGGALRQRSFEVIRDWVRRGGVLWTDFGGPANNEFRRPIAGIEELTGLKSRAPEAWGTDPGYHSTALAKFGGLQKGVEYAAPAQAAVTLLGSLAPGQATAAIAREPVSAEGSELLAAFADGKAAAVLRKVGQGRVYVVGTHAGLSYSEKVRREDYDMTADFDASARRLISCAALQCAASRPVICAVPNVETVLVQNGPDMAVYLMNWAYAATPVVVDGKTVLRPALQRAEKVSLEFPGLRGARKVEAASGHATAAASGEKGLAVTLDRLDAADVIVLRGVR
jgi:hypothetical protein